MSNRGKLLEAARKDMAKFSSKGGFQEVITLTNPSNGLSVTFTNLHTKHHLGFDTEGQRLNSKSAHITIVEKTVNDLDYITRNPQGEIDLRNHVVSVPDSNNVLKKYVINEAYPSETFGIITCILGDYQTKN